MPKFYDVDYPDRHGVEIVFSPPMLNNREKDRPARVLRVEVEDDLFIELSLADAERLREYLANPPPPEPTDEDVRRVASEAALEASEICGPCEVTVRTGAKVEPAASGDGYWVEAHIFVPKSAVGKGGR